MVHMLLRHLTRWLGRDQDGFHQLSKAASVIILDHGCFTLKQWMRLSSDPSAGKFKPQCIKEFLIISDRRDDHALRIHYLLCFFSVEPSNFQSLYLSVQRALNVLFHETSGAWIHLVRLPGTKQHQFFCI